jgi:SulP family sulfate permease
VWLVYVVTHPALSVLGREHGTQVFRALDEHPEDETFAGVVVLRMDGGIFFATADAFEDRARTALLEPGLRGLVLDFAGVNFVDSQGSRLRLGHHPESRRVRCRAAPGGGAPGRARHARAG